MRRQKEREKDLVLKRQQRELAKQGKKPFYLKKCKFGLLLSRAVTCSKCARGGVMLLCPCPARPVTPCSV